MTVIPLCSGKGFSATERRTFGWTFLAAALNFKRGATAPALLFFRVCRTILKMELQSRDTCPLSNSEYKVEHHVTVSLSICPLQLPRRFSLSHHHPGHAPKSDLNVGQGAEYEQSLGTRGFGLVSAGGAWIRGGWIKAAWVRFNRCAPRSLISLPFSSHAISRPQFACSRTSAPSSLAPEHQHE